LFCKICASRPVASVRIYDLGRLSSAGAVRLASSALVAVTESPVVSAGEPDDRVVARVDIPLVGGPLDGRTLDVEVDDEGRPPEWIPQTRLWLANGSALLDKDLAGRYELNRSLGRGRRGCMCGSSAGSTARSP
jgi:hypothetical protein